jgi:hypothetical protein
LHQCTTNDAEKSNVNAREAETHDWQSFLQSLEVLTTYNLEILLCIRKCYDYKMYGLAHMCLFLAFA